MVALQADDLDPLAAVLVPALLAVDLPRGYASQGQAAARGLGRRAGADSAAAAYLNATWRTLLDRTFRDELPPSLWPDGSARWVAVVERLLVAPSSPWWDDLGTDDVREGRDEVLAAALVQARDDLTRLQAVDPDEWRWGAGHTLDLRAQPTGRWDGLVVRRLLDRLGTRVGGTGTAVAATAWDAGRVVDPGGSPRRRLCGWSSTSPTSTGRAGWRRRASPATRPAATTTTSRHLRRRRHAEVALHPRGGRGGRHRPAAAQKRVMPLGTRRGGDPAVVRLARDVAAHLVGVEQHAGERARRHPGQGPVVGPAAPAEPQSGRGRPPGRGRARRRRRPPPRDPAGARGLAQAASARPQRGDAAVHAPSRGRRRPAAPGAAPGSAAPAGPRAARRCPARCRRDVGGHRRGGAHLGGGEQVLRAGVGGLAQRGHRAAPPRGEQLVAGGELGRPRPGPGRGRRLCSGHRTTLRSSHG